MTAGGDTDDQPADRTTHTHYSKAAGIPDLNKGAHNMLQLALSNDSASSSQGWSTANRYG